jgi:hypothetical protein
VAAHVFTPIVLIPALRHLVYPLVARIVGNDREGTRTTAVPILEERREAECASYHGLGSRKRGVASIHVTKMDLPFVRDGRPAEQWPAPGSEDTELGVFMEPEVSHGKTKVYTRVQA